MNIRKHSLRASIRAFRIWQKLGVFPWAKPKKKSAGKGGFSKGAFDSIPFLNDDAKRTFVHLLLRPGYMIRDYINGQHERFLAPLTSLIIFYAFFAMLGAIGSIFARTVRDCLNGDIYRRDAYQRRQ